MYSQVRMRRLYAFVYLCAVANPRFHSKSASFAEHIATLTFAAYSFIRRLSLGHFFLYSHVSPTFFTCSKYIFSRFSASIPFYLFHIENILIYLIHYCISSPQSFFAPFFIALTSPFGTGSLG